MIFPATDTHFTKRDPETYQRAIYDLALNYVKGRACAVDIGAHVGIFTRRMEMDFETVLSFEPEPENFRCLQQNCTQAKLLNYAVYDRCTMGALKNPKENNSGAWEFALGGQIQAVTLDSFELDELDLIKIDVQGSESAVLAGAKDTLARCKPVLIVENPAEDQLKALGYRIVEQVNKDGIFIYV